MRIRVEKWLMQCDYCKTEANPNTAITGVSNDGYKIFETPWGYIYCDEDSCWCGPQCLCAWISIQCAKLQEASS